MRIYLLLISCVYIFCEDLVCKQPLFQGGAKRVREKKEERGDSRVHRTARWTTSAPINCVTVSSPVFRSSYALQTFNISISSWYSGCTSQYQTILNFKALDTNLRYFNLQAFVAASCYCQIGPIPHSYQIIRLLALALRPERIFFV